MRGLYMYVLAASNAGACDKKSNSKYPFPFETVSVVGILNIVDCAIAVCAVTTNKRATNNPERTLPFFTVLPAFLRYKKKRPAASHRDATGTSSSSEFFCRTASCGAGQFCSAVRPALSNKYFGDLRRPMQNFPGLCHVNKVQVKEKQCLSRRFEACIRNQ